MKQIWTACAVTGLLAGTLLSGCAAKQSPPVPDGGDRESRESVPLESIPETPFETIDPLEQNAHVVIAAQAPTADSVPAGVQSPQADPTPPGKAGLDPVAVEDELLLLINMARSGADLSLLEETDAILWASRIRASELLRDFSHIRPNGHSYYTVFDDVGFAYSGKWHGENAATFRFPAGEPHTEQEIAQYLYSALAESLGHTRNMLRAQYAQIGVGVSVRTEEGETTVVSSQLFASA